MFRSGAFVADHVTPVTDEQVQPNGVDLTLEAVFEPVDRGHIGRDGKSIADRRHRRVSDADGSDTDDPDGAPAGTHRLPQGGYVVRYAETVAIPEGHVGFIYPRSSLLRNACMLNTAVWDAGYEGSGEGLLRVHHPIDIDAGARIAQIVLARANHEDTYDGSYQGERVE